VDRPLDAPHAGVLLSITDEEFRLFRDLIRELAGISLGPHKRSLLIARLSPRMRAVGASTFSEYYRRVTSDQGEAELERMIECICTGETRFFREPRQFEWLRRELLPTWTTGRRVRVWSAACSTGEEPYSLAMTLLAGLAPANARDVIEILATDLSMRSLEHAQRAIYPIERSREIPYEYLRAYMLRGNRARAGEMKAGPELRELVSFRQENLLTVTPHRLGRFDIVFCRNVLIYFDTPTKAHVLERLVECVNPGGYLFLGYAESMHGQIHGMGSVAPSVYRRPGPKLRG